MQEATEKRYLYIFVILDAAKKDEKQGGILSLKSAVKQEGQKGIRLVPYLKDFPFSYYCIVSDLHQLPAALGSILVQYFSFITNAH
jgi:midasin (ATPase involved in ribosome maturation)